MVVQMKKRLAALKHGAYSAMTVLPGESIAEFEQLHQQLSCEWTPNGVLETETITTLARLLWRKKNLSTFRIAELARKRMREILDAVIPTIGAVKSDEFGERTFNRKISRSKKPSAQRTWSSMGLGGNGRGGDNRRPRQGAGSSRSIGCND
jgi:hypothetical protein